jgi:hypothetical protein
MTPYKGALEITHGNHERWTIISHLWVHAPAITQNHPVVA